MIDRQIRRTGIALAVAFVAVFVQLNYVQIFAAEDIASNQANIRRLLREYSIKRGDIVTVDGVTLASVEKTGGKLIYRRTYPGGDLYAHATGYYSVVFGTARIEQAYNEALLGDSGVITMQDIEDRLFGGGDQGDDVRLTIHSRLQQVARQALGSQHGAVVAMDPGTGEVRAMWSNPSYDPGPLASHNLKQERKHWRSLEPESPTSSLVDKVTSRGYPPGSSLKVVVAAAALESGNVKASTTFPDPDGFTPPQTNDPIENFSGGTCVGGGQIDLTTALTVSCNTVFARLGLRFHEQIQETAERFGFNDELPFDVGVQAATFPEIDEDNLPLRALQGIGQASVVATPLQMAVVAATVANDGVVPRPRLVRAIISRSGEVVTSFEPETIRRAVSQSTAETLTAMMAEVVQQGSGTAAQIAGIQVAGKTGTAQTVKGADPHAWFIAFAPTDDPKLAVAVLVENGGSLGSEATGGAVAAPIAKAVIEADRQIRGW